MHESAFEGVRFIEGRPRVFREIAPVSVEIGGGHAQLRDLDDVKRELARLARLRGGNAVVDFRYGQRSVGFLRSIFSMDDVAWYGSGTAAYVPA